MRRAAAARGADCPLPFGSFDPEFFVKDVGWSEAVSNAARDSLLDPLGFERRFAVAPSQVIGLAAHERGGAFRAVETWQIEPASLAAAQGLTDALGVVPEWDAYFMDLAVGTMRGPGSREVLPLGFRLFLEQAPWTQTLITDAFWDTSLPSRAIVEVVDQLRATEGLDVTASHDSESNGGEARTGWLTLRYGASYELAESQREVRVRMPFYADGSHALTVTQGAELLEDVREFFYPDSGATVGDGRR
jgi:hypothetical protein